MSILIASSDVGNNNDNLVVTNSGTIESSAEIFTISNTYILQSASVWLRRLGNPSGNLDLAIESISGTPGSSGVPTNTVLDSTNGVNVLAFATSYTLYNFNFGGGSGNGITLTPGNYALVVRGDGFTGLGANLIEASSAGSDVLAGANLANRASSWTANGSDDLNFYIYASNMVTTQTQTGKLRVTVTTDKTQA